MNGRLLAVMGSGVIDASQPVLTADDLGVLRGDGVFETVLVGNGSPWLLAQHLARLARSAERLDLAAPSTAAWCDLVDSLLARWPAAEQGALRLVCTRGAEGGGPPTAYATIAGVPAETQRQQAEGVRVVTLSLGLPSNIRQTAPWLLGGVKTTSYAVAMAALREARRRGADDVVWLSAEGDVLEAPTATVVWSTESTLCTVPVETGILAGTTTEHLFARAVQRGLAVDRRPAKAPDLHDADAVWLLSAVRGAAPVVSIDGRPRGDAGLTSTVRGLLGLL